MYKTNKNKVLASMIVFCPVCSVIISGSLVPWSASFVSNHRLSLCVGWISTVAKHRVCLNMNLNIKQ